VAYPIYDNPLVTLDVFWTELSPTRAVVYARLTNVDYDADWRLSGTIRGPRSSRHQTLPATFSFTDLGPGPTHLARCVIPDPSYWSPESPNLYDVMIELHRREEATLVERRQLGFRPILAGERYLLREGKTWIPRGYAGPGLGVEEAQRQGLVEFLGDSNWEEASSQGAYVASLLPPISSPRWALRETAKHPAVAMAFIRREKNWSENINKDGHNLLLVHEMGTDTNESVYDWADAVALPIALIGSRWEQVQELKKPILVVEDLVGPIVASEARAYCDALQRRLVSFGQFAGYFVRAMQDEPLEYFYTSG